jgi:hypothetical protein
MTNTKSEYTPMEIPDAYLHEEQEGHFIDEDLEDASTASGIVLVFVDDSSASAFWLFRCQSQQHQQQRALPRKKTHPRLHYIS